MLPANEVCVELTRNRRVENAAATRIFFHFIECNLSLPIMVNKFDNFDLNYRSYMTGHAPSIIQRMNDEIRIHTKSNMRQPP